VALGTSRASELGGSVVTVCRILVAEDDVEMRSLVASVLRKGGYQVLEAESGPDLLARARWSLQNGGSQARIDLVISDVRMPGCSGLEALSLLRHLGFEAPIIVVTAFGDAETHAGAARLGAKAVLDKPFDLEELRRAVRGALG
jgi:CheY-like chemotaxis protein